MLFSLALISQYSSSESSLAETIFCSCLPTTHTTLWTLLISQKQRRLLTMRPTARPADRTEPSRLWRHIIAFFLFLVLCVCDFRFFLFCTFRRLPSLPPTVLFVCVFRFAQFVCQTDGRTNGRFVCLFVWSVSSHYSVHGGSRALFVFPVMGQGVVWGIKRIAASWQFGMVCGVVYQQPKKKKRKKSTKPATLQLQFLQLFMFLAACFWWEGGVYLKFRVQFLLVVAYLV